MDHAELHALDLLAAPLVHPGNLRDPVCAAVQGELENADERRARFLQEPDAVLAEVIEVAVAGGDDVDLSPVEAPRELRVVADPRVERDADQLRRLDQER